MSAFTTAFKINPLAATYSLKTLEQEEIMQFNEVFFKPSTVVFTISREELNNLEKRYPELDSGKEGIPCRSSKLSARHAWPCFSGAAVLVTLGRLTSVARCPQVGGGPSLTAKDRHSLTDRIASARNITHFTASSMFVISIMNRPISRAATDQFSSRVRFDSFGG